MISSQNPKNWLRKFGVPHQTSFQAKQLQAVQVALIPNPLFHWHTRFGKVQPRHLNDQELFEEQKRICDLPRPALTDRQMIFVRHTVHINIVITHCREEGCIGKYAPPPKPEDWKICGSRYFAERCKIPAEANLEFRGRLIWKCWWS